MGENKLIDRKARTYERVCFTTSQDKTRTVVGRQHLIHSPRFIHESMFYTQSVPVDSPQSAVRSPQPAVRSPQTAVRSPQSAVRSPQSAVRSPQSAVRSPQSAVRSPQSAVRS